MKGGRGSLSSIEKYLDRNPCAKQSFRKRWRDQVLISSKRNQAAEHTHIYARDFRYGARITRERSKIGARIDPGGRPPMPACPSKPSPKVLRTKRKSSILIIHRYSYNFLTHASPPPLPASPNFYSKAPSSSSSTPRFPLQPTLIASTVT